MEGRTLLKQGLGWIVGDGKDISIWKSPWLSLYTPQAPIGPPNYDALHLKVSDLINQASNSWDLEKIRQYLPQYEGQIQQIFLSSFKQRDSLVWLPDKSGVFSSKTGYNLGKSNLKPSIDDEFKWWDHVWKVNTSPKVQNFMWKIKNRALLIGDNLAIRGITSDLTCKKCGAHENELHILLKCPFAMKVWDLLPSIFKPHRETTSSLSLLFSSAHRMVNLPPCGISVALYPWIFWQLWKARNLMVFENREITESEVIGKVLGEARSWQEAQLDRNQTKVIPTRSLAQIPIQKATNCFIDAAWTESTLNCGLSWIFTNQSRITLVQGSATQQFVSSALVAEALALKAAISAASSSELREINVFSDSLSLVSLLSSGSVVNELKSILFDIRCLLRSFSSISFIHIPRLSNMPADALAKAALLSLNVSSINGVF